MIGFVSPRTGAPLLPDREGDALVSADGERVPIVNGIPRFVSSDDYAAAFGLQWNLHARTQLDSRTGAHLTEQRLTRCSGLALQRFSGLRVLEAGAGAFPALHRGPGRRVLPAALGTASRAPAANAVEPCLSSLALLPHLSRADSRATRRLVPTRHIR